jgi:hypothetical protein
VENKEENTWPRVHEKRFGFLSIQEWHRTYIQEVWWVIAIRRELRQKGEK